MTTKERPILFSDEMVRRLLSGQKTQTRRVIKPQPVFDDPVWWIGGKAFVTDLAIRSYLLDDFYASSGTPYGCVYEDGSSDIMWVRETWRLDGRGIIMFRADYPDKPDEYNDWKSPIHLPKNLSRIRLKLLDVDVQLLQEISHVDVLNEGVPGSIEDFSALWNSIHKRYTWESNPWVWVLHFERIL